MTTTELQQRLDTATETQGLDFKADIPWEPSDFAKDILAMTNTRDGGMIVVGVRETPVRGTSVNGFEATGVSEENMETYKIDTMRDQLAGYADPAVEFFVEFPKDTAGRPYVVIRVSPFREVPVICKKGVQGKTIAHVIYYRNSNRRVESAPVSNAADLRDIIEHATVQMMRRRQEFGYTVAGGLEDRLNAEASVDDGSPLLSKIKSRGYWKLVLQPLQEEMVEEFGRWIDAIERAQVQRYWYYPYIARNGMPGQEMIYGSNYCGSASELGCRKEYWRAYKSGQFVCYNALQEDWFEEDEWAAELAVRIPPKQFVQLRTSILIAIPEMMEFVGRLGQQELFKNGVRIKMSLHGVFQRRLIWEGDGPGLITHYKTSAHELPVGGEYAIDEVIQRGMLISVPFIKSIISSFGMIRDESVIREDLEGMKNVAKGGEDGFQ